MERKESATLNYQLIEKLGSGGMGQIYKAHDTRLNRFVAVKILPPEQAGDPERQRRFLQEAQAASALNHPNIVTIHNIINEGDMLYIVMEYITGKTLRELISEGSLRIPQVLRCAAQMANALGAAHAAGIIHRDLKPANIMITDSGLVKILDFGLAKWTPMGASAAAAGTTPSGSANDQTTLIDSPLTMEGSIVGTLNYMAPEQAEGKRVDARADIFSFGAVLYEMVTGRRAFDGDSAVAILSAVLRDEVAPMARLAPDTSRELEDIVGRCLRKAPQERWQSMTEVETALNNLRRKPQVALPETPPVARSTVAQPEQKAARAPRSRKRLVYTLAILAALIVGRWWSGSRRTAQLIAPPTPTITATPSPAYPASAPSDSVLTNESIIKMVLAEVPASVILGQIRSSKTNFDLSTKQVIGLSAVGVPAEIIEAMRDPERASLRAATPALPQPSLPPAPRPDTAGEGATTSARAAAPVNNAPPETVTLRLHDALPFRIILTEDIPADADEGQAVSFRVADGVQVGDITVISKGATVAGEVAGEVGKKKFLGIGAGNKMSFRLLFAESVENEKIRVRATPSAKGDAPPMRPFETGKGSKPKDAAAARGTEYIAYIDGEQTVSVHK